MKKRIAYLVTSLLVNAYMAFTAVVVLFNKRKKRKFKEDTASTSVSHARHSMSKG